MTEAIESIEGNPPFRYGDKVCEAFPPPAREGRNWTVLLCDNKSVHVYFEDEYKRFRLNQLVLIKPANGVVEVDRLFQTENLKPRHVDYALRGYIYNGCLQVLDNTGNPIKSLVDVSFIQPLAAAQGRGISHVQLTCLINLYDSKEDAVNGEHMRKESKNITP